MHRWKFSVLAVAAVASFGFYTSDASALALGRLTVQSALGEPLRAEIDLPQITPAEADSLRATAAKPEVFRAQGMEYTPAMNNLRVQLQRRPDGSAVLQVSSDRPVNEPFVDLVLDASWGAGRVVRSYTMLFDPPALRRATPEVTAAPQTSAAPAQAPATSTPSTPSTPRTAAVAPSTANIPSRPTARPHPAAAAPAGNVTVRAGDTASRIANAHRPASISLDQMLVALLRANPDAFIQGNINRIKAGAILQLPEESAAQATPTGEARQILAAQSRDFNTFRRKLAGAAPATEVAAAQRSISGTVQARVEDKKPTTAAPDKLTLSKATAQGQKTAEDQLAKDRQTSESAVRMADLSKNITELNKLSAASAASGTPGTAASSAAGTVAAPLSSAATATPTSTTLAASGPVEPASSATLAATPAQASASQAAAPASQPAAPPKPAAPPAPAPTPAPSFLSDLLDDPLVPLAGGVLLAVLLGYGAYRVVQQRRRNQGGVDSSFMESRVQPDSFFGASGGQRVDTTTSDLTTGSSMAYSPSQLDAGGDVDPVAEADVYLAYGRDLQAEEILKEALRHTPGRVSVHVKLGEIYAKRQDRKALEAVAAEVFKLTQGEGSDWARIAELGRELEPANPLYQPGGRPDLPANAASVSPAGGFPTTIPAPAASAAAKESLSLDLDLDLDLDLPDDALTDAPAAISSGGFAAAVSAANEKAASASAPAAPPSLDIDLPDLSFEPADNPPMATTAEPATPVAPAIAPPPMADDLDFSTSDLGLLPSAAMPLTTSPATEAQDSGPMEFDLGDLSLYLNSSFTPAAPSMAATAPAPADDSPEAAANDPLATKLALAKEFNAIGDSEGARTLIEEVLAESTGALKARAERLLADLG